MAKDDRKQLNVRVDDEFLAAVGDIQRLDRSELTALSVSDVVKRAVMELADRLRRTEGKRK